MVYLPEAEGSSGVGGTGIESSCKWREVEGREREGRRIVLARIECPLRNSLVIRYQLLEEGQRTPEAFAHPPLRLAKNAWNSVTM